MTPPAAVPVSQEAAVAIARRHGLDVPAAVSPLPGPGIINTVLSFGPRHVLRVPRDHPAHVGQLRAELVAIPAARAAGVCTPAVVAFDDTGDLLPVPYLIVERVDGVDLETLTSGSPSLSGTWRSLGRDLARLHGVGAPAALPVGPFAEVVADPHTLVGDRVADGWLGGPDARWLEAWLDKLAPLARPAGGGDGRVLVHGDAQLTNVLGDRATGAYRALIDWGCARSDDPAADFVAVPLRVVPALLAGHRELAPVGDDASAEARIVWRRLQVLLAVLPRGGVPGHAWAERPVAGLVDLLAFFTDPPGPRWRRVAPPRR